MPKRRGRPAEGADLVDKLHECSGVARTRLKLIFQTVAGECTIERACQTLGINRSAFNKLRQQFIADAAQLLEPKKPGRKKKVLTDEDLELKQLRSEVGELKFQLRAQQVREEIGLIMPRLLRRPGVVKKTNKRP
jgi:hypothetical protein